MPRQITVFATLLSLSMIGSGLAQSGGKPNDISMRPSIELPLEQAMAVGQVGHKVPSPAAFQPGATRPTPAMLTEIVTWLATNFDLPAIYDHPGVELARPMKIAGMRYKGLLPDRWREDSIDDPAVLALHQREVVAVYNDTTKTIFLPEAWAGTTPAELSILVHEMVHHLQNLAKFKYECPAAREKLAYQAQDQWLKRFGQDLEKEFEIDMLTLLVTSGCMN